jgi:copper(I)-binding protein
MLISRSMAIRLKATLVAGLISSLALAQGVGVMEPWVRATVAGQQATGAFMKLNASQASRLVQADSPVAGLVELHEMRMDKEVMRMSAIPGIDLPAGRSVELKPGGYHLMLLHLKQQIKDGETVPITLTFQAPDGKRERLEIKAQARTLGQPSKHGH